jgi:hypothetical protein
METRSTYQGFSSIEKLLAYVRELKLRNSQLPAHVAPANGNVQRASDDLMPETNAD